MKKGLECEGRLKGLPSLFITADELKSIKVKQCIVHDIRYQQLYILDERNILTDDDFRFLKKVKSKLDVIITLEIRSLSEALKQYLDDFSIMFSIEIADPHLLKDTDQIKLTYNNHVLVSTVECMHKTEPKEFLNDIEIVLETIE